MCEHNPDLGGHDALQINLLEDLFKTNDIEKSFKLITEYFKKKYVFVECSIFLVNNTTDELNLVYSSKIPKDEWKLARYKRGEGFTGWVFKYKKMLYIKKETDDNELNEIFPEKPIHAGKEEGKPIEVDDPWPYLAAPIISKGTLEFCLDDIIDLNGLIKKLKENRDNEFIEAVYKNLGEDLRNKIDSYDINNPGNNNDQITQIIVQQFNILLKDKNMFNLEKYNKNIYKDLRKWLEAKKRGKLTEEYDTIILNRTLFDLAFSKEIEDRYVIGVIRLSAKKETDEFTAKDIDFFSNIASRISAPIENSILFHKQKRLIETYAKIGKFSNLSEFLDISLSDIISPKDLAIDLLDKNNNISIYIKSKGMKDSDLKILCDSELDDNYGSCIFVEDNKDKYINILNNIVITLNSVIQDKYFFADKRFEHVNLSQDVKILLDIYEVNQTDASLSIANRSLLAETYPNKIGKSPILKLLDEVVTDIPEIVGGGGCSIFLKDDDESINYNKKFIIRASTAVSRGFKQHIKKQYYYSESEKGLTSWVAAKGTPILVNDIQDEQELKKINEKLVHIDGGPCEIIAHDVGPFLAVPIKNEKEIIGVIRIPRHRGAKPFDIIDLKLLCAFSNQLSLVIWNLNRKEKIEAKKVENLIKFYGIFSKELIKKGRDVLSVSYSSELRDFFNKGDENDTYSIILDLLDYLWCIKYKQINNFPILKNFKRYEAMLFELPKYRDHFIHQFQVFLLGTVIIDIINKSSKKSFSDYYRDSLHIKEEKWDSLDADMAWLICSSFHDVAYPIERSDQLFNRFFDKFMGLNIDIIEKIGLEKVIFDGNYSILLDELCDLYVSLMEGKCEWEFESNNIRTIKVNNYFSRNIKLALIDKRDHGVLSSLILLHQSRGGDPKYSKIIYPAALSICLHNKLYKRLSDKVIFENNPLAFLLIYCDLVQEWGRGIEDSLEIPTLKEIKSGIDENNKIHIKTKILLGNPTSAINKAAEAEEVFSKLVSHNLVFEFEIENNGRRFITSHEC